MPIDQTIPAGATHFDGKNRLYYRTKGIFIAKYKKEDWEPSCLTVTEFRELIDKGQIKAIPVPVTLKFQRGDKVRHPNGRQLEVVANHKGLVVCWDPEYRDYEGVPPVDLRTEEEYWEAMADETQRREETEALRRVVEKHHIIGLKTSSAVARELHRAGLRVVEEK